MRFGRRPHRLLVVAAAFTAVASYLVLAASPAGAGTISSSLASGYPGQVITLTATGFGIQPTGAPGCFVTFTITMLLGGTTVATFQTTAPPVPDPDVVQATIPNVAPNTYDILASCTSPPGVPPGPTPGEIRFTVTSPPPTTTTTTTTLPPTTTTTQVAATTTTRPRGATTTTKPNGSTTSSSSSTTTTTTKPKPGVTTTTTTATPTHHTDLVLSRFSIPPAGSVVATGRGCNSKAAVELTVNSNPVGHTRADAGGAYTTPLDIGSLPVGQYQVVAHCGLFLTSSALDIVLATQANADTATMLIIVFFLLIGLALFRRRIRLDSPPATNPVDQEEDDLNM